MPDDQWRRTRFPNLFRENYVDYADCRVQYTSETAPKELVSRLHLVAVTAETRIVVCAASKGGGSCPEGRGNQESLWTTLLGANFGKKQALCSKASSATSQPMWQRASRRIPIARTCRIHARTGAYAVVDVGVVGVPSNPPDGEAVVEVLTLPPVAAAAYLHEYDPLEADVLRHADAMGPLRR